VSGWRKCDTCRKVRSTDEYDGGVATCRSCLTAPAPRRKAAPVTRTTTTPRPAKPAPAAAGPRQPLLGTVGNGDLEVRERRARRKALELLAESHPEEFAMLLRDARAAEGLRPMTSGSAAGGSAADEAAAGAES
jgi:hypothetical protein